MREITFREAIREALIEEMEKEYIIQALQKTGWHRENAAALLGITRKMLGDRINKYGLKTILLDAEIAK